MIPQHHQRVGGCDRSLAWEIESRYAISFWRVTEKAKFCAPGVIVQSQCVLRSPLLYSFHFHILYGTYTPFLECNVDATHLNRKNTHLKKYLLDNCTQVTEL